MEDEIERLTVRRFHLCPFGELFHLSPEKRKWSREKMPTCENVWRTMKENCKNGAHGCNPMNATQEGI